MNDRFKFRAWDDKRSKMLNGLPRQEIAFTTFENGFTLGEISSYPHNGERLILLQCTGLRDRNGTLIYEGDVVEHNLWGKGVVIWEMGMFRVDGEPFRNEHDVVLGDHQLQRTKIIGNIYEHPNLLTP